MSYGRNIGVVNELNVVKNNIDLDKLTAFMSKHDDFSGEKKSPDYLIFDNLSKFYSDKHTMTGLRRCRKEAETLANEVCAKEPYLGQRVLVNQTARCDVHMWFKNNLNQN